MTIRQFTLEKVQAAISTQNDVGLSDTITL